MKKIYPLVTPIKKYYESFYDDIISLKQKNPDIREIKKELLTENIIN